MSNALQGLKVLDLSMNLPGPYMTWLLCSMGAEVLKLENPIGGDYARVLGGGPSGKNNPLFEAVNRNKKSLTVNLKHEEGRKIFLRLLDTYDILVEGFRPGTMERMGLGFDEISARHPRLIQVSISGYGQEGPYRLRAGHDLNYLSLAGVIHMNGTREGDLAIPGVQIADLAGGALMALSGLLMAVLQRQTTGKGQLVDTSMFHGSLSLATMIFGGVEAGLEKPGPATMILNGRAPCYGLYRTKDRLYMSLGAIEFKFWQNFCIAVERPDLVGEQWSGSDIVDQVAAIFAERNQAEWIELMKQHDACCEPVIPLGDAVDSDLVLAGNMVNRDSENRRQLASPFRLSDSPPAEDLPAPGLGDHTREVLSELGFSSEEMDSLAAEGVI